jgi:hypothetical protein
MPGGVLKSNAAGAISFTKQAGHEKRLFTCMFSVTPGGDAEGTLESKLAPMRQMASEIHLEQPTSE